MLTRVGTTVSIGSVLALKWCDSGVFPIVTFIQLTSLTASSYYADYQEQKQKYVNTQISGLVQNSNNYQLNNIAKTMDDTSQMHSVNMCILFEPTVTVLNIGFNSVVGSLDNYLAQEKREQKLQSLRSEIDDKTTNNVHTLVDLADFLASEIKNHAIVTTYAPLHLGLALIGLQAAKTYITWHQTIGEKKDILDKFQNLIKSYPEGVLNDYFDCSKVFGDKISVTNKEIVKTVLDKQCIIIEQVDETFIIMDHTENILSLINTSANDYPVCVVGLTEEYIVE